MKFATKQFPANGTAALALLAALLEHMERQGTLIAKDKQAIIERAQKIAPQGVGIVEAEAREILASML